MAPTSPARILFAIAALTVAPAVVSAMSDCLRLDDRLSPTRLNAAWGQYLPTHFEVAQGSLGETHLRFDDGSGRIVMVFDDELPGQLIDLINGLSAPEKDAKGVDLTFSAWFEMGPKWHFTGPYLAHARLARAADIDGSGNTFELEFQRLVSEESPYTSYHPSTLHFSKALLASVAGFVAHREAGARSVVNLSPKVVQLFPAKPCHPFSAKVGQSVASSRGA